MEVKRVHELNNRYSNLFGKDISHEEIIELFKISKRIYHINNDDLRIVVDAQRLPFKSRLITVVFTDKEKLQQYVNVFNALKKLR